VDIPSLLTALTARGRRDPAPLAARERFLSAAQNSPFVESMNSNLSAAICVRLKLRRSTRAGGIFKQQAPANRTVTA